MYVRSASFRQIPVSAGAWLASTISGFLPSAGLQASQHSPARYVGGFRFPSTGVGDSAVSAKPNDLRVGVPVSRKIAGRDFCAFCPLLCPSPHPPFSFAEPISYTYSCRSFKAHVQLFIHDRFLGM